MSKYEARILNTLTLNVNRNYYVKELEDKLKLNKATLNKSLKQLTALDFVSKESQAGRTYVILLQDNPLIRVIISPLVDIEGIKFPFSELSIQLITQLNKGLIVNTYHELGVLGSVLSKYIKINSDQTLVKKTTELRNLISKIVLDNVKKKNTAKSTNNLHIVVATLVPIFDGLLNPIKFAALFTNKQKDEIIPALPKKFIPKIELDINKEDGFQTIETKINEIINLITINDPSNEIGFIKNKLKRWGRFYLKTDKKNKTILIGFNTILYLLTKLEEKSKKIDSIPLAQTI